jgi:hypothetical protein
VESPWVVLGAVEAGIDIFSSWMAFATSCSVDPNRSPMTLMASLIAVVIFAMWSSDVMELLLFYRFLSF